VKMYPRWPTPPLSSEAREELVELLGAIAAPGRAKSA